MGSFKANVIAENEEEARTGFLNQQEGLKLMNGKIRKNVVITSAIPDPNEEDRWILIGTHDMVNE